MEKRNGNDWAVKIRQPMLLTRLRQVCDGSNKLVVLKPGPEKISVRDAQKASALRLHGKVSWVGSLGIMAGWIRGEVQ